MVVRMRVSGEGECGSGGHWGLSEAYLSGWRCSAVADDQIQSLLDVKSAPSGSFLASSVQLIASSERC